MGFLWESDTGSYVRTHTAYLKHAFVFDFIGKFFADESGNYFGRQSVLTLFQANWIFNLLQSVKQNTQDRKKRNTTI